MTADEDRGAPSANDIQIAWLAADRDAWITAHGSERLRLALSLGLAGQSLGVYRDERLAHELPGWQWADRETRFSEAINPSLKALELLRELRADWEGASLVKVRSRGGGEWREAISFDAPSWAPGRRAFRLIGGDQP